MKTRKFIRWVLDKLLHYPDIHLPTVQMFMDKFQECLSPPDQKQFGNDVEAIRRMTSTQLTLDTSILRAKTKNYERELNEIKNGGKENNAN